MNTESSNPTSKATQKKLFGEGEFSSLAEAILSSAGVGIYIVQNGTFVYVSPLYQKLTGYSEKELIGTRFSGLHSPGGSGGRQGKSDPKPQNEKP